MRQFLRACARGCSRNAKLCEASLLEPNLTWLAWCAFAFLPPGSGNGCRTSRATTAVMPCAFAGARGARGRAALAARLRTWPAWSPSARASAWRRSRRWAAAGPSWSRARPARRDGRQRGRHWRAVRPRRRRGHGRGARARVGAGAWRDRARGRRAVLAGSRDGPGGRGAGALRTLTACAGVSARGPSRARLRAAASA